MTLTSGHLLDDGVVTVDQAGFCSLPGYLIVRLTGDSHSLADLPPATARHLGDVLRRAAAALERAAAADRVYVLSFCEVDRRLHFHLFPRTAPLLAAYRAATGAGPEPPNGPLLFEWAREAFAGDAPPPPGTPAREAILHELRRLLAQP